MAHNIRPSTSQHTNKNQCGKEQEDVVSNGPPDVIKINLLPTNGNISELDDIADDAHSLELNDHKLPQIISIDVDSPPDYHICNGAIEDEAKDSYYWDKRDLQPPIDCIWEEHVKTDDSWFEKPPIFFFGLIFDDLLIQHITNETKNYAMEKDGKDFQITENEIKAYLGILMLTGIIKVPSYKTYWNEYQKINPIADCFSLSRFEEINHYLHFNSNSLQNSTLDNDRMYKIRPVIEAIRANCQKASQEEYQYINEQIIASKIRLPLPEYDDRKQYQWGYKLLARAGASGYIYDFEIHNGTHNANSVLQLADGIPKYSNFKIFYSNRYSSIPLAKQLKDYGIHSLSTIHPEVLTGCTLKEDQALRMEGQGNFDYKVETTNNLLALKWCENNSVYLLSTYAGVYPTSEDKWNRTLEKYVTVSRPEARVEYDKFMGGINLNNMLMELSRIDFESRKWYMTIFCYIIDLAVVNAWLLYRRTCDERCVSLCDFKSGIALGLMDWNNQHASKAVTKNKSTNPPKKPRTIFNPPDSVRYDNIGHLPNCVEVKRRCKLCVKGYTRVICIKCKVGLCLTNHRNCYLKYHTS